MTRILQLPLPQPSGFDPFTVNAEAYKLAQRPKRHQQHEDLYAFQVKAMNLPPPARQFLFALELDKRFTADFAWTRTQIPTLTRGLLVEIQGGIWRKGGGAHSHPTNIERDIAKQQSIALLGYAFLPLTEKNLKSGHGIELTIRMLERLGWKPTPKETPCKTNQ